MVGVDATRPCVCVCARIVETGRRGCCRPRPTGQMPIANRHSPADTRRNRSRVPTSSSSAPGSTRNHREILSSPFCSLVLVTLTHSKTERNDVAARRPDRINYLSWGRLLEGALVYKHEQGGATFHCMLSLMPLFRCSLASPQREDHSSVLVYHHRSPSLSFSRPLGIFRPPLSTAPCSPRCSTSMPWRACSAAGSSSLEWTRSALGS